MHFEKFMMPWCPLIDRWILLKVFSVRSVKVYQIMAYLLVIYSTALKLNMEPKNYGFQKESPFPGSHPGRKGVTDFRWNCGNSSRPLGSNPSYYWGIEGFWYRKPRVHRGFCFGLHCKVLHRFLSFKATLHHWLNKRPTYANSEKRPKKTSCDTPWDFKKAKAPSTKP